MSESKSQTKENGRTTKGDLPFMNGRLYTAILRDARGKTYQNFICWYRIPKQNTDESQEAKA